MTHQELLEQNDRLNRELEHLRQQVKAEEASEAKVKSLINNQDASIWSIDVNYNYVILNDFFIKAYKEAFGIELIKGAPALEILEPELAAFWRDKYDQALGGKKIDFEFVHELNGRESFYQVSLNPVISNNEVTGVSALSTDITNQKLIEAALAENNANMLAIMDNTLESIWAIDTAYNILFANSVFKNEFFTSFNVQLNKGVNLLNSLPEPLKPIWKPRYDRALNNERFSFVDEIDTGKQIYYVEVSMNPIMNNGKVVGASFFANDITRRTVAQKALKENEKRLEELNHTKDKFFSIIAHDLRSPFNSILGLSNLLVENIVDDNDIETTAQAIQKSAHQSVALISNLLEWARSQTGKIDYQPDLIDINNIIREELISLEPLTKQKQIQINNHIAWPTIAYADQYMLGCIMRNLLSNAIKFTNPSGQITLSAEYKENQLIVSIKDSGVGIDATNIPKLFVIDQNHSTSGTHNEQGTGLGLVLCKEFIEMHGGKIWVRSEKNKGSEFSFTLPSDKSSVV